MNLASSIIMIEPQSKVNDNYNLSAIAMQDTTLMVIHRDDFLFVFGNKKNVDQNSSS